MQTTKIQAIQDVTNTWGSRKKRDLIALGEGKKNYPEILAYLENEIANSQKWLTLDIKYHVLNDGVYQLHKSIEERNVLLHLKEIKKPSIGGAPIDTIDGILSDGTRRKIPYGTIQFEHG
jgi:hypothetical protein